MPVIDKLTTYYGKVIHINKRDAVSAMILHVSSTDEDPKHYLCPDGEELCFFVFVFCFFVFSKKGQAKGEMPKHEKDNMKTELAPNAAKELEPVYA